MKCSICGVTDKETRIINSKQYGCLCRKHYLRVYKGKNINRSIYDANEFVLHDDYAEIILFDRYGNENGRAIIDLEDVEKCRKYKWHKKSSRNTDYVMSNGENRVFLHRLIMNYYNFDKDIDHINRNGLDNRKSNLRIISHSKNIRNQGEGTGIKQVPSGNYQAVITVNNESIYLGTFSRFEDALEARQQAEEAYE